MVPFIIVFAILVAIGALLGGVAALPIVLAVGLVAGGIVIVIKLLRRERVRPR